MRVEIQPQFLGFQALARNTDAAVIPVVHEVVADTLTPVSVFAMVGKDEGSFLLESVVGGEKWGRYSFVGFEPDHIVRGKADQFETLRDGHWRVERGVCPWERLGETLEAWRAPHVDWLPRFWGGAVGYVGYDAVRRFEPRVGAACDMGDAEYEFCLSVGGPLFVFDSFRQTLMVVVPIRFGDYESLEAAYATGERRIEESLNRLRGAHRIGLRPVPATQSEAELPASSFDREAYCRAVERAQEYIRAGDIFQVVLSQRFRIPGEDRDLFDVYRAMRVINPSPYMYFLRLPEVGIAGASPETLVRLEEGVAEVRPIAGTRHRGRTEEEDAAVARGLLEDPKERAEHVMLVDLGRNDLGRISQPGTVDITESMVVERFSHVMHMTSNVRGTLQPGRSALDVFRATFPAGTLSGAPKVRAMQIIEELEPESRGIYGGAVGYFGFDGNMDVAIAIRTVVEKEGEFWLQAGAGIVEASKPNAEYEETINKVKAGLVAVEASTRPNAKSATSNRGTFSGQPNGR